MNGDAPLGSAHIVDVVSPERVKVSEIRRDGATFVTFSGDAGQVTFNITSASPRELAELLEPDAVYQVHVTRWRT